jgi:glutathione S-transferase
VRCVSVTLYAIQPSHPCHTARLMLEHKGIQHKVVDFVPGTHAVAARVVGFKRGTVPALRLDGERVQGSRQIARALDVAQAEPSLFPAEPEDRLAVEEAEQWGDEVFQDTPRMLTRWLTITRPDMRVHMATEAGVPAPRLLGPANAPVARYFARRIGADDTERVRGIVIGIPEQLDRVDGLIADGVIGGPLPNAADFQIAPSLKVLMTYEDIAPVFEGRPAAELATRLLPTYPTSVPAGFVPREWLEQIT